jgi:hypothetical protein
VQSPFIISPLFPLPALCARSRLLRLLVYISSVSLNLRQDETKQRSQSTLRDLGACSDEQYCLRRICDQSIFASLSYAVAGVEYVLLPQILSLLSVCIMPHQEQLQCYIVEQIALFLLHHAREKCTDGWVLEQVSWLVHWECQVMTVTTIIVADDHCRSAHCQEQVADLCNQDINFAYLRNLS